MRTDHASVRLYQARRHELRSLVDSYYTIQDLSKGAANKERSYRQGYDLPSAGVPVEGDGLSLPEPAFMAAIRDDLAGVEHRIGTYLEQEADKEALGRWCMSIDGVGGALAAGLLAFIDFHRCCCQQYRHLKGKERKDIPMHDCPGLRTAGAIWAFAGLLDKEKHPWLAGQRRPYNVRLKTHCWKIADQFRRQSVNDDRLAMSDEEMLSALRADKKGSIRRGGVATLYKDMTNEELVEVVQSKKDRMLKRLTKLTDRLYVRLYMERKERDTDYNEEGRFKDKALALLENVKRKKVVLPKSIRDYWSAGRFTPGGIDLRAMRYAVTIFLSHYHQIGREIYFGDKVTPWVIAHGNHTHYIPPPNWPMK